MNNEKKFSFSLSESLLFAGLSKKISIALSDQTQFQQISPSPNEHHEME